MDIVDQLLSLSAIAMLVKPHENARCSVWIGQADYLVYSCHAFIFQYIIWLHGYGMVYGVWYCLFVILRVFVRNVVAIVGTIRTLK